ncbi:MAG: tRNA lysidine(34) synthetase TilS [Burkholderiales bacterium]|nr:tRNA lysidine(34) synthetase TilS [Burkholderiales bacterium]
MARDVVQALDNCAPALPLGVAFSGGADSTALLVAAARRWPGAVYGLHVHHGLQRAADGFEAHAAAVCRDLGVAFHSVRVDARHAAGESPEDAARRARYLSLAQLASAQGLQAILLGQHADDQAETLLLALSRGAGLPGLSAMPRSFERHGMRFERPWLDIAGKDIRAWLAQQGVAHVEDPSNADTSFTRNRIRHELLPALERAFPQFRETFARSARHVAQARALLAALAEEDLAAMGGKPVIARLQALPRDRQANVLRHWLRAAHGEAASAAQLEELLDQVADCTTRGHALRLKVGRGYVTREETLLRFTPPLPPGPDAVTIRHN